MALFNPDVLPRLMEREFVDTLADEDSDGKWPTARMLALDLAFTLDKDIHNELEEAAQKFLDTLTPKRLAEITASRVRKGDRVALRFRSEIDPAGPPRHRVVSPWEAQPSDETIWGTVTCVRGYGALGGPGVDVMTVNGPIYVPRDCVEQVRFTKK